MKRQIIVFFITCMFLTTLLSTTSGEKLNTVTEEYTEQKSVDIESENDLPSYFSWRDIDGVDFTTSVKDQKPYASCETFAIVAAVETMVQWEVGFPFECDLSEAHLYFHSGGNFDWGSYPENDTNYLVEHGVPDEACWPYPTEKKMYPLNTTCRDWENRTVKIRNWSYLPEDPIAIKKALVNNGPVPTYFHVYKDWVQKKTLYELTTALNGGIYKHKWGKNFGPHYVCIVGYNDDPGYWIVKGSWGTKYQDDGWFKIAYGECGIEKKSIYIDGVYGNFPITYVDDDNTNGPWDGTKKHPYQTIQEGINNSYQGYTVYVKNGTYNENIVINKKINLDGENRTNTIIDGNNKGHVIDIAVEGAGVSGFTIQNSGSKPFDSGIKTRSLNSNATITDNLIKNCDIGLFLNYAYLPSSNTVEGNIVQNNRKGIYAHWSYHNTIKENIIQNNSENGLELDSSDFFNIESNTIKNNGKHGIYLKEDSNDNKINFNTIKNNEIGINIEKCRTNRIIKNNFIDNQKQAVFSNSFLNLWLRNYWEEWNKIIPKIIAGKLYKTDITWINIDWMPSNKEY